MHEHWRQVVGYEGRYEVSDQGRVRSCERTKETLRQTCRWPAKTLKPFVDPSNGYLYVNLGDGTGSPAKKLGVHILVLEAFRGPRPEGLWGLHGDGNRQNPRLANLRWGTPADNSADARRHGTSARGERGGRALLTHEMVTWIRESRQSSLELAPVFGVASSTIRAVRLGKNWAHL